MTNADDFDADVEQTGGDEFTDAPAEEAGAEAAAPAPAKSGGGMGLKLLVLLVVLAGGAAGAIKMGFIHSPVAIPGLTPATPSPEAAATPAPAGAPVEVAQANMPAPSAPQPVSGPDASPPAMTSIAPRSGEKPADAPAGDAMMPPPVASQSSAPAMTAPDAPAMTPEAAPAIAAPGAPAAPPALTAPAMTAPAMTAPAMSAPPEAAAPPAVGNPEDAAKLQKLDDRITALEQSVKDMKDSEVTKADLDALKTSIDKLQQNVGQAQKMPGAEMPAAVHETRHAHTAKPAAHSFRHHAAIAPHASTKVVEGWVLKSAKPGTAWISQPGSPDIRSVSVGETVPGLGKVTSISQDSGGHWVVSGTRGRVNQ